MKRLPLWLLIVGVFPAARAQTPDAEFLEIYNIIQAGESFERSGQSASAVDQFQHALKDLQAFAKAHPGWNERIIKFRLEFLNQRLNGLKEASPAPAARGKAPPAPGDNPPSPAAGPAVPAGAASPDSLSLELAAARTRADDADARATTAEARMQFALHKSDEATARANDATDRGAQLALELRQARDRVEVLEASHSSLEKTRDRLDRERVTLDSRLKEALSPRAAAIDPAELAKAEDRILLLVKENEILKAGLDHQMAENRRVLETSKKAVELEQQLELTRTDLASARRQTDELRGEKTKLQTRLDSLGRRNEEQTASLRNEIESLRKDVASARNSNRGGAGDASKELTGLRTEISEQRAAAEKLRRENETLLQDLQQLTDIRVTPASLKVAEVPGVDPAAVDLVRVRRLEHERDELARELDEARAEIRRKDKERERSGGAGEMRTRDLSRQVDRLEARLTALESKPDPYTPEELALFQAPARRESLPPSPQPEAVKAARPTTPEPHPVQVAQASPATNNPPATPANPPAPRTTNSPPASTGAPDSPARRRTAKDLPPGASILAAQAQRAFAMRRLDEAEKSYREILKLDENNIFTLGNLAAIIVEQGRIDEGDAMLKRVLALDPQDPFSLSLLGIIRFRQQRYDEAFDALSQSAKLDPDNSETQNYLGITLSQRGQRVAAEAALRKALKLNPASPAAHYNLAVVYATQKPSFLELARYHYERSRRAGQPANPDFEALLRGESAAVKTP